MRVSQIKSYQSEYLKASDLAGPAVAVIQAVLLEEIFNPASGKKNERLLLVFRGRAKRLVVNKTTAGRLVDFFGDDTQAWPGQPIRLVPAVDRDKATILVERPASEPPQAQPVNHPSAGAPNNF